MPTGRAPVAAGRQVAVEAQHARQHALDVAVEDRHALAEAEGGDRRRGGAADARQRLRARRPCAGTRRRCAPPPPARSGAGCAPGCSSPARSTAPSTSSCGARGQRRTSGKRCEEARVVAQHGATWVCCSMTSDSQTRYGSRVFCQGSSLRPWLRCQRDDCAGESPAGNPRAHAPSAGGAAVRGAPPKSAGRLRGWSAARSVRRSLASSCVERRFPAPRSRRGARRGPPAASGCARPPRCGWPKLRRRSLSCASSWAPAPLLQRSTSVMAASLTTRSRLASARTSLSQNSGCASLSTLPTPRYWMWLRSIWLEVLLEARQVRLGRRLQREAVFGVELAEGAVQHGLDLGRGRLHLAQVVAQARRRCRA